MSAYKIETEAYNSTIKRISRINDNAGALYLPRSWIGKKAMVVLLEPDEEE